MAFPRAKLRIQKKQYKFGVPAVNFDNFWQLLPLLCLAFMISPTQMSQMVQLEELMDLPMEEVTKLTALFSQLFPHLARLQSTR